MADITPAMMRDGFENLNMTAELMESLGAPGIGPEFQVTCEDHGGPGMATMQQWDAESQVWVTTTPFIASDSAVIDALVEEDSMAYAEENGIELADCGM